MRIACPACNAAYQVPDDQLREGRVVRCARCGTDWAPIEAIPEDAAEPSRAERVVPSEPEPIVEPSQSAREEEIPLPRPVVLPTPPRKHRAFPALALAWLLSLVVVGGAAAALGIERDWIMAAWPPSIRGYAAVGLAARH